MALTNRYVSSLASGGSGTELDPWDISTAFSNANAGDILNVIADGYYDLSSELTPTNSGTRESPIIMRGCKNTIGDGWGNRTNGGVLDTSNMPVFRNTSTNDFISGASKYYWIFESLRFESGPGGTKGRPAIAQFFNSDIVNCSVSDSYISLYTRSRAVDCDVTNETYGIYCNGGVFNIINCRLTGNTTNYYAIYAYGNYANIIGCLIHDISTDAIRLQQTNKDGYSVIGCTIANCSGAAIYTQGNFIRYPVAMTNNIITGCAYPFYNNSSYDQPLHSFRNRIRDCTSGNTGVGDWYDDTNDILTNLGTGDEQDYINAAGGDYRLSPYSPARQAGLFGWNDIGALRYKPVEASGVAGGPDINKSRVFVVPDEKVLLLECPTNSNSVVQMLQLGNIDGSNSTTVDLYLNKNGAGDILFVKGIQVDPGQAVSVFNMEQERLVLENLGTADQLSIVAADPNIVAATISYTER